MKVLVLGGGGKMARATVLDFLRFDSEQLEELVLGDINLKRAQEQAQAAADSRVKAVFADSGNVERLTELMSGFDVVISGTVPLGEIPELTLRAALAAGVHIIDLGTFPDAIEACEALHADFERAGLTSILGLGSSPGTMNLIAKTVVDKLDSVDSLELSFAYASLGTSTLPLKIPFLGALTEFSASPLIFREGKYETLPPMSGIEDITYPDPIGVRRCFTIGHAEVFTLPRAFKDKGLRNVTFKAGFTPEFFEQGKLFQAIGLLSEESIEVDGTRVAPMAVVEKCADSLPPDQGDIKDYGVSRVVARGRRGEQRLKIVGTMMCYPYWGLTAAQHRTGHSPAIGARMLLSGQIGKRGVFHPEACVDPALFFAELAKRELEIEIQETMYA